MRYSLMLALLVVSHSLANDAECNFDAPIDSEEKAWCAVSEFLAYQSCASAFGFERDVVEFEDRWELSTRDLNPTQSEGCRALHLAVCKDTGEILYSPDSDSCDANSIEN